MTRLALLLFLLAFLQRSCAEAEMSVSQNRLWWAVMTPTGKLRDGFCYGQYVNGDYTHPLLCGNKRAAKDHMEPGDKLIRVKVVPIEQ